jgi:hypothetical protein
MPHSSKPSATGASESRARRAAPLATLTPRLLLASAALAAGACGAEQAITDVRVDSSPPTIQLTKLESMSDSTIGVAIDVRDNLGIKNVRVRMSGGLEATFDTTFTSANTSFAVPLSFSVSRSVPTCTAVLVTATATDGASNSSGTDSLHLRVGNVAPPSVRVTSPKAGELLVVGKSAVISLSGVSACKVRAIGYTTSGPYVHSDSVVYTRGPLADSVAALDTLVIPQSVQTGILTVTPFIVDSLGQRAPGEPIKLAVQTIGNVSSVPVVRVGLTPRIEVTDTLHVEASDPTGIRTLGYEVRSASGALLRADSMVAAGTAAELTSNQRTFSSRLPVTSFPTTVYVKAFARNSNNVRSYAKLASGADRVDTVVVVDGVTRPLPNGGKLADGMYMPRFNRLYLTNIERNQVEVFNLADSTFMQPIDVGSRPWGIAGWPRTRGGEMGDTLLVANSGGTNISYVSLRSGSNGREVYRYPLPNIIVYGITTEVKPGNIIFQKRRVYDFSDRPQFLAPTCDAMSLDGPCGDVVLVYSTTPTAGQSLGFANRGTVRWENLNKQTSHFFWEQAAGQSNEGTVVDTLEIERLAAQGVGSDSLLVPFQQWAYSLTTPDSVMYSTQVDITRIGFRDTTFARNSANFRRAIIGEGGDVLGSRTMMYDVTRGMSPTFTNGLSGQQYFLPVPVRDLGVSRATDVSDIIANANAKVQGVAINFDGELAAIRGDSTYIIDPTLRLQGLLQTTNRNSGFDFHPGNKGLTSSPLATRLAFAASTEPVIEIYDTHCYRRVAMIPVRDPIIGPIKSSVRSNGELMLVGASARGVIIVSTQTSFPTSCP